MFPDCHEFTIQGGTFNEAQTQHFNYNITIIPDKKDHSVEDQEKHWRKVISALDPTVNKKKGLFGIFSPPICHSRGLKPKTTNPQARIPKMRIWRMKRRKTKIPKTTKLNPRNSSLYTLASIRHRRSLKDQPMLQCSSLTIIFQFIIIFLACTHTYASHLRRWKIMAYYCMESVYIVDPP